MMLPFDVRRDFFRWSWCLLFVGIAHAAVLVGMLVNIQFGSPDPAAAAMVIEMAPTPVAMVTPPTEIPPGPPQLESRPVPRMKVPKEKLPFDPPPEVRTETPPEVLVQKEPEDVPDELLAKEKPVDVTTATPTATAPPDDKLAAPHEGASSMATLTPEQTWESLLLATMERNKRYPGLAQMRRQEDVVYVRFAVDRKGKVLEYEIERSRGYELLDREVVALLERSSPLPPPPQEIEGERVEVVVPVEFFIRTHRS
ncbi:MAG: energy transducer TonB [Gammaproteobacteria bacterium]